MGIRLKTFRFLNLTNLLSDQSLTRKATLNAMASILDYAMRSLVALFITPFTVSILGDYLFGTWQVLTRFIGFISPTSGRPSTVLRYTLAHHQVSANDDDKRRHVGSAVAAWLVFLPLVIIAGGIFSWFIPYWLAIPGVFIWKIRLTAAILVVDLAATGIGAIPQAVMQGQNLGYKRMGYTVVLIILGGGITWLFLALGYGIIGVAVSTFISTILAGLLMLKIMKTYSPWFGIAAPGRKDVGSYLNLSGWFVSWDIVFKLLMTSDVIILGLLNSVESVTSYTLTKYTPEMLITIIAIVVFGIAPGLGGIIGSKDYKKAAQIRGEIFSIAWLIIVTFGTTFMLWNRVFLDLWVGPGQYTGTLPMLLILLVVAQFVLIRIDANFIDLTLKVQQKVLLGALSVGLTIFLSVFLVKYMDLGISGVLIGMLIGRLLLTFGYPMIVGRVINHSLFSQLKVIGRPLLYSVFLFSLAYLIDTTKSISLSSDLRGWIGFLFLAGSMTIGLGILTFFVGYNQQQRKQLVHRIRLVISSAP